MSETLSVTVPTEIPIERIKNLLTSAFDEGMNPWIESAERVGEATSRKQAPCLSDAPFVHDGYLRIKDIGDGINHDGGWFNITPQTIQEGLVKMAEKYPKAWADFLSKNEDMETADTFLQCVCFGEVIYG